MRYYVIAHGRAEEIKEDNTILKNVKNQTIWSGTDLENKDIKIIDIERNNLRPIVQSAITARFSSLNQRKQNFIMIVLIIMCIVFGLQWSNYKAQTVSLTLLLEQTQKEKNILLENNTKKVNVGTGIVTKENINADLNYQNGELKNQLEISSLNFKKQELILKNNIDVLEQKNQLCEEQRKENRTKTDLEMYKEIEKSFIELKKIELKNIVKYEFLDQARELAQKYCNKLKK